MTLRGMAFLPIWHGIEPPMDAEFNRWHTVEHMPERVATPGITVGRRYHNEGHGEGGRDRYFTLYEAQSFEVFGSEGYYATANARSEWTQRVHPAFTHFMRSPCYLVMTRGRGIGGALATIRVKFPQAVPAGGDAAASGITPKDAFTLFVRPLVEGAMALDLVTGAHAGVCAPVARQPLSQGSLSLRPGAKDFDAVVMIEAIHRAALRDAMPKIEALLRQQPQAVASWETALYDLAYVITSND